VLEGKQVALIGAGVMAEVLALGLIRSKLVEPADIVMSHYRPDRLDNLRGQFGVRTTSDNGEAYRQADIAVLCVRPQAMGDVLNEVRESLDDRKLLTTIAAGVPISFYEQRLGKPIPFVRSMPTFFGRIKAGTTGLALNKSATAEHLALASRLYGTISERRSGE